MESANLKKRHLYAWSFKLYLKLRYGIKPMYNVLIGTRDALDKIKTMDDYNVLLKVKRSTIIVAYNKYKSTIVRKFSQTAF